MKFKKWLIAAICSSITFLNFAQNKSFISNDSVSYVKLLLVGDIPMDKKLLESTKNVDLNTFDFNSLFYYIKPILNLGDIVVGNLDNTFGPPPYATYPLYKSPEKFATALKYAGFNLMMTANSKVVHHTIADWSMQRKALEKVGIMHTGSFITPEDKSKRNPIIIEKKGIKVAFLNYMQGISYSEEKIPIINAAKEEIIKEDIELAKSRGAEFIVVYFNWGAEYQNYPNTTQQKLGNFAVNQGAHLVVGSRPHVVQQLVNKQIVLDKKLHEYIIAYSLGDFYTTSSSQDVNGSVILEVIISKSKINQKIEISQFGFISTYTALLENNDKNRYIILPVSEVKKGNITLPINASQKESMIRSNDKVKFTLADVIDEIQYELDDKIIADFDEVLTVSKRPLNEEKGFKLELKEFYQPPKENLVSNLPIKEIEAQEPSKPALEVISAQKVVPKVFEEIDVNNEKVYYKVQFLALKNKIDINIQYYSHLRGYEITYEEGYYKYLIGQTTNLKAINDFCLDIKRLGHKNAFVVAYRNGQRIKF